MSENSSKEHNEQSRERNRGIRERTCEGDENTDLKVEIERRIEIELTETAKARQLKVQLGFQTCLRRGASNLSSRVSFLSCREFLGEAANSSSSGHFKFSLF